MKTPLIDWTPAMDTALFILEPVIDAIALLVIATVIVVACKRINKMFPQIAERIMDATPWMGWTVTYEVDPGYPITLPRRK